MKEVFSIYIPTYRRNSLLFKTISSTVVLPDVKVIVSDNNDDEATSREIISFIKNYRSVVYHRNEFNIGLDRNMLGFFDLCKTKYCLLLGDDDLLTSGFNTVKEFIYSDVDFFLLNNVDIPTGILNLNTDLKKTSFFESVWDKMPFGTLIINVEKARLIRNDIAKYIGTYHAYSAIPWEILFSEYSSCKICNISTKVINIGVVEKTWKQTTLEIHLSLIPTWFNLLPDELKLSSNKALITYRKRTFTYSFFKNLVISKIWTYNVKKKTVDQLPLIYRAKFYVANLIERITLNEN